MVRYIPDTESYADLPCNPISKKGKAYKKEYQQMTTYEQISQSRLANFTEQFLKQNFKQAQKVYSLLYQGTQANIYQEKWSKFQNQASDYQTKLDSLSSYIDKNLESLDRLKEQIIKDFQKQMQLLVEKMSETIFSLISEYNELVDSHFKNMTDDINNTLQMINIQSKKLDDELEKLNSNQERKLAIEQISLTVNLDRQKIQAYAAIFKMTPSKEELIQNLADQSARQQQNLKPLQINCDQMTCKEIYCIMKLLGKIPTKQTQSSQIKKTSSQMNNRFSFEDQIDQKSVFKQIQKKIVASNQKFKQKTQNLLVQKKRGPWQSGNSQMESQQIQNLGLKEFLKMINQLSQMLSSQVNKSLMNSVQKNIEESFVLTNQFSNLESYNEHFKGWDQSYRQKMRNESKKVYQVVQVKQEKKQQKPMQCENRIQKIKNTSFDNHQKYDFSQQQSYYSQKLSNKNRGKGFIENSTDNIDTVNLDDSQEVNQQNDQNSVLHHQSENEQSVLQPQIIQPVQQQYQDHYVERMKLKTFIEEQVSRAERQQPEDIQPKFKQQKQRYNIKPQNYQMKSGYQKKPKEYQTWKAEDIFKKTPQQQQIVNNWSEIKQRRIEDSSDIIYRSRQDEKPFEESDFQGYVYGQEQIMNVYGQKRSQNYFEQLNDRQFQEEQILSLMKQYDVEQQKKIYEQIQKSKNSLFEQSPYQKSIVRRSQNVYARQFQVRQHEQKRKQQQRNNQILKYALNMSIEQQQLPNKHILGTSNNRIFQPIQPMSRNFLNERLKPREQQRMEQRRFENELQNSFDYLQELFSRILKRDQTFSIQSGYDLDFMEEDEKQYERNFRLISPQNRITNSTRLTIKQVSENRDKLIADEQYFVILVKVIKPVLLTFKIKEDRPNLPMTKLIVGDQTGTFFIKKGIAVLYMNYYCDVKAGCCLRLQKARLYQYMGSYELNHHSRLYPSNMKEGNAVPYVKMESYLSHIHPNLSGELTYPKKCYYNQTLEDIMRTFVNHRRIIAEESRKDPIILTVCEVLPNKKYILGDYTGKIMADFMNYRQSWFQIGQTLVIRGAKFINTGIKFYISTQKSTRIIQTDLRWKFTHDMKFIPKKTF